MVLQAWHCLAAASFEMIKHAEVMYERNVVRKQQLQYVKTAIECMFVLLSCFRHLIKTSVF